MPLPSLIKPILLTTSLVVGASVALYETNPNVRYFVDTAALKLSHVFEDILSAIDEGIRNLSLEQREVYRRRQRDRVSMVAMPGREPPPPQRSPLSQVGRSSPRSSVNDLEKAGNRAVNASGREELKAKRRRLWELAESAPPYTKNDDPAVEVAPALPECSRSDAQPVQETAPILQSAEEGSNQVEAEPSHASQLAHALQSTDTTDAFEHVEPVASNSTIQQPVDEDVSSIDSHSLIATLRYSPSLSAATSSQPPSPAPEDLVDTLSSMDDDDEGGMSSDTETMSHVSAYSFRSHNGGGSADGWDADVISVASSDAEDWEEARTR